MLRSRELRPLLVVALLGVAAAIAQTVGLDAGWLHLAPVLVLVLPLLAGRYVGEEQIARLAARRRVVVVRRPVARTPRIRPRALVPRGGLLLAAALAQRGPPAGR
jgi:hypothetical protein